MSEYEYTNALNSRIDEHSFSLNIVHVLYNASIFVYFFRLILIWVQVQKLLPTSLIILTFLFAFFELVYNVKLGYYYIIMRVCV